MVGSPRYLRILNIDRQALTLGCCQLVVKSAISGGFNSHNLLIAQVELRGIEPLTS